MNRFPTRTEPRGSVAVVVRDLVARSAWTVVYRSLFRTQFGKTWKTPYNVGSFTLSSSYVSVSTWLPSTCADEHSSVFPLGISSLDSSLVVQSVHNSHPAE